MDDLISRQAALEKVRTMQTYKLFMGDDMILVDKAEVQTELMMLPSAQPEPCEDAVSREDVLNEIYDSIKKCERALASNVFNEKERFGIECEMKSLRYSLDVLENLPSVQPEPKEGHWILYDKRFPWRTLYKCSECGNYLDFSGVNGGRGEVNFCPNCGSYNGGGRK